jgi:hypothetical protein
LLKSQPSFFFVNNGNNFASLNFRAFAYEQLLQPAGCAAPDLDGTDSVYCAGVNHIHYNIAKLHGDLGWIRRVARTLLRNDGTVDTIANGANHYHAECGKQSNLGSLSQW